MSATVDLATILNALQDAQKAADRERERLAKKAAHQRRFRERHPDYVQRCKDAIKAKRAANKAARATLLSAVVETPPIEGAALVQDGGQAD